jgi:menaquinone-dependent protoporphyrinogen oxidase
MTSVLVAYATKHGSTQEVAAAIAAALRQHGATVRSCSAAEAPGSLGEWDLVVLGGALYSGRWHRHAHRFLKRHRHDLDTVPIAVFAMGPRTDEDDAWRRSRAQLDRALAKRPWLRPAAVSVFGGVDPAARRDRPRRDLRDWGAIETWARSLLPLAQADRPRSETL